MPKSYPLDWPTDTPRSESREESKFKTSFDKALTGLRRELRGLGALGVCVSTNLPPARDGWPDPRARLKGDDPAVAVYWQAGGKTFVLACDSWDRVQDNLHAIVLTLGADRGKIRWGCASIKERALAGYLALPEPPKVTPWWEVLGVDEGTSIDVARAVYRTKMKMIHPDYSKNDEDRKRRAAESARLNAAIEAAEKEKTHVA